MALARRRQRQSEKFELNRDDLHTETGLQLDKLREHAGRPGGPE